MDTGLMCLGTIARFHQLPIDEAQLTHQFGVPGEQFSTTDILRAAKALTLKAKLVSVTSTTLHQAPLPAIVKTQSGEYFILAKISELESGGIDKLLIHDLRETSPQIIDLPAFEQLWTGELILLTRRSSLKESLQQAFDITWFIPSFVKYRRLFGEIIVASFFLQLFALVTPLFFQVIMDKVLVHRGLSTLDVIAFGFFVISVFEVLLSGIRNYVMAHSTNRVDVELGARLFHHLLALPIAYFESRQVGQSVARVHELNNIRNFITGSALTLVIDLFFTFVFLAVMWYYSPQLCWIVIATIPFYILLSIFITPMLRHRLDEKFKHGATNTSFLTEAVTGVQTVKAMAVEPQMQRKWEDQLANYVNASFRSQNLGNVANQIASLINKLMTLGIIWWGAHLVMDGELTVGQLVAFNMLAGRVSGPILKLVQLWQDFQQAGISIARLGDILNTPREPGYNPNRSTLPNVEGRVEFEHVRFRYRLDSPSILDDFNLQINAGEVIGIVGRSGSGKSTLTKLVQRLYVPESGRVLVDGVDLSMVDTTWLRRNIGVVLQENFLFSQSVRENIALVNPAASMEEIVRVATLAGAHEFIVDLPEGYDSQVGEQGCNLSGGQRQRLAIARALLTNPRILIFDEATSALDYESERIIQDNMAEICKGRTVFIIAHRLSTVRICDRIIVMSKGHILEQGTHDNLLAEQGYYAQLHGYQNHTPVLKTASKGAVVTQSGSSTKPLFTMGTQTPPQKKDGDVL
ncbi:MAG: type I secretion system permease/ATPase [Pseudomonadota bacterium]